MALDKLVDSAQLDSDLTSVANAIRAKGGTSAQLAFPAGFVDAVEAIETGGGGGASSGSVTVTERTRYLTINMGGEYDHILVVQRSGTGNQFSQDGNRYTWAAWGIRGYSSPTNNPNAKGEKHRAKLCFKKNGSGTFMPSHRGTRCSGPAQAQFSGNILRVRTKDAYCSLFHKFVPRTFECRGTSSSTECSLMYSWSSP